MDAKLKHLELIRGVVNRLAADFFRIKGRAVVLVDALLVLVVREDRTAPAVAASDAGRACARTAGRG